MAGVTFNPVSAGNSFVNNTAAVAGGAIFVSYCAGKRPYFPANVFTNNTAKQFPSQIGANALTISPAQRPSFASVPAGAGCLLPNTTTSNFTGMNAKSSSFWCGSSFYSIICHEFLFVLLWGYLQSFLSHSQNRLNWSNHIHSLRSRSTVTPVL